MGAAVHNLASRSGAGCGGGISVALGLGLPHGGERDLILAATYAVVLFTVIVQRGAIAGILQRLEGKGTNAT